MITRGDADDEEFAQFFAEVVAQMAVRGDVSAIPPAGVTERRFGPAEWLAERIGQRFPWLQVSAIARFTEDVWAYLTRQAVRKAIDAIVIDAIPTDEPSVVISHSLGTVVAYNVLTAKSELEVPLWVTLGSPLGLNASARNCNRLPSTLSIAPSFALIHAYRVTQHAPAGADVTARC